LIKKIAHGYTNMLAHDFVYRFHGKWVNLSVERFDAIRYADMAFFKVCLILSRISNCVSLHDIDAFNYELRQAATSGAAELYYLPKLPLRVGKSR
jgi:hypothetical protein